MLSRYLPAVAKHDVPAISLLEQTPMRHAFVVGSLVAVLSLTAAACGAGQPEQPQQLAVSGSDQFRFDPAAITVRAGRPVQLTFRNAGTLEHDFVIAGLAVHDLSAGAGTPAAPPSHSHESASPTVMVHAAPQQEATVSFTPIQKGTYEFFCTVTGHREAGMKGTLTVD